MGKIQGNSSGANAITGIDHVLVGVGDLEGGRRTWENLGFTLTPRGRHKGWGTANYCVMFDHDYIELLGIVDARRFTNNPDKFLDQGGEGLLSLALATDDAEAAYRDLRRAGVEARAPRALGRLLDLPEGTVDARFSLVHLPPEATPGLMALVCQHLTPDLVRRPTWLVHANGAQALAGATVAVEDRGTAAPAYERLFGADRVARRESEFSAHLGDAVIRFREPGDGLVALSVRVADTAATARCLDGGGIPFARPDAECLRVPPEAATGVALTFVPAA